MCWWGVAYDRNYTEAANLASSIISLTRSFQELTHLARIAELMKEKEELLQALPWQKRGVTAGLESRDDVSVRDSANFTAGFDNYVNSGKSGRKIGTLLYFRSFQIRNDSYNRYEIQSDSCRLYGTSSRRTSKISLKVLWVMIVLFPFT